MPKPSQKKSHGVGLQASLVAMAPARSMTSHLRRRYRERYLGRYRFARLVFGFDVFLFCILIALLLLNATWLLRASFIQRPGLSMSFTAPPLESATIIPVYVRVSADDDRVHNDVSMRWHLPEWVDVLQADPPIQKDGRVRFGRVAPGNPRESHLLVHVHAAKGARVPFVFRLTQFDPLGLNREVYGSDSREVVASALEATELFVAPRYADGADVPIAIHNRGNLAIPAVSVQLDDPSSATIGGKQTADVGELLPNESRVLFIRPSSSSSTSMSWSVLDGPQVVATKRTQPHRVEGTVPVRVIQPLVSDVSATSVSIDYQSDSAHGALYVVHPLLLNERDPFFPAHQSKGTVTVPLRPGSTSQTKWVVIPVVLPGIGVDVGPAVEGVIQHALPFHAEARYYTDSGDQIGVGPIPPKVNEETTYWIVWSIGPTDDQFRQVVMSTVLPGWVQATGKFVSSVHGDFEMDGPRVNWSIPSLTVSGNDVQTFAFEVRVTPTRPQQNEMLPLMGTSTLTAIDSATGVSIHAEAMGDDTRLIHDKKAQSDGKVQGL